jgi:DNA-directed RNA polymerase specialized sigma24 family protein
MTASSSDPRVPGVDRSRALELLPEVYARALLLRQDGRTNAEIARALDIPPEAAASTLELAEAKLGRLMQHDGGRPEPPAHNGSPQ